MVNTHVPVLLSETVTALALSQGEHVVDATLGLGGHAEALLVAIGPSGQLLGIERTEVGLDQARVRLDRFRSQITLIHGDFRDLQQHALDHGWVSADAILFDLGLVSWQIDTGYQGVSFHIDQPLDMRLSPYQPSDYTRKEDDPSHWTEDATLARIVRTWRFRSAAVLLGSATEEEISNVIRSLGEPKGARSAAMRIVSARAVRPIKRTHDLVMALGTQDPSRLAPIFQALRILVNDEFGALSAGLSDAWSLLKPNGRLAVISFQSGEDRIVKRFLKTHLDAMRTPPVRPTEAEVTRNRRSRSALLRVAIKQLIPHTT